MRIIARTDTIAVYFITPGRRQSKTLILSTNVDQKSIETDFSIVICRPIGNHNTISCDYYPRSSIVKSLFDSHLPGMFIITAPALCIARCCLVFNYEKTIPAKRTITATAAAQVSRTRNHK